MKTLPGTPYRLLRRLGRGGMGEVYEAEHTGLGRRLAIKVIRPESGTDAAVIDRMRLEAQTLARIVHPNVVAIHDVGTSTDGTFFLAMDLLSGESLYDRFKREGALPLAEVLRITRCVLAALGEAHRRGFVHRDVKPANVFLCHDGAVKLLDFGISKVVSDHRSIAPLSQPTAEGLPVGTPFYFAPEQALGEPVDVRADLYSVGVMLWTLLVGRRLFGEARDLGELIQAHVSWPAPPPSAHAPQAIPPALDQLVLRALAKAPRDRLSDAVTFDLLLAQVEADQPGPATPALPEAPPVAAWVWILVACGVGLVLALAASQLAGCSPSPDSLRQHHVGAT